MNRKEHDGRVAQSEPRRMLPTPKPWSPSRSSQSPGRSGEFTVGNETDESGEFQKAHPAAVERTQEDLNMLDDAAEPSGLGLSWSFVREGCIVPVGLQLRAIVEALRALDKLHAAPSAPPGREGHGSVCDRNLMFRSNGTAFFLSDPERRADQPAQYTAPELILGAEAGPPADIYAVGVMLLEALIDERSTEDDMRSVSLSNFRRHPIWQHYEHDPLLQLALRAACTQQSARWLTAGEFADAIVRCATHRIDSIAALVALLRLTLQQQEDRATPVMPPSRTSGPARAGRDRSAVDVLTGHGETDDAALSVSVELDDDDLLSLLPPLPAATGVEQYRDENEWAGPESAVRRSSPDPDVEAASVVLVAIEAGAALGLSERTSTTLVSQGPATPTRRPLARRIIGSLELVAVVAAGAAAVHSVGAARLQRDVQESFAAVSTKLTSWLGSDGAHASTPAREANANDTPPSSADSAPSTTANSVDTPPPVATPVTASSTQASPQASESTPTRDESRARGNVSSPTARPAAKPPSPTRSRRVTKPQKTAKGELDPTLEESIFGRRH
jgi:hypothetical protein